jgi:threonine synthase
MTKQTDRLTRVEGKVDEVHRTVQALFNKFDDYVAEAQKGRIDCTRQQSKTDTQTNIQWYFIAVIIVGLVGIGLKSIGG